MQLKDMQKVQVLLFLIAFFRCIVPPVVGQAQEQVSLSELLVNASDRNTTTELPGGRITVGLQVVEIQSNSEVSVYGSKADTIIAWNSSAVTVATGAALHLQNVTIAIPAGSVVANTESASLSTPEVWTDLFSLPGLQISKGGRFTLERVDVVFEDCAAFAVIQQAACSIAEQLKSSNNSYLYIAPQVQPGVIHYIDTAAAMFGTTDEALKGVVYKDVRLSCSSNQTAGAGSATSIGKAAAACLVQRVENAQQLLQALQFAREQASGNNVTFVVLQMKNNISISDTAWPATGVPINYRVHLIGPPHTFPAAPFRGHELDLALVPAFVVVDPTNARIAFKNLAIVNMAVGPDSTFPVSMLVGSLWAVQFDRPAAAAANQTLLILVNCMLISSSDLFDYISRWSGIAASNVPLVSATASWLQSNLFYSLLVGQASTEYLLYSQRVGQGILWINSSITNIDYHKPSLLESTGITSLVPNDPFVPLPQIQPIYNATQLVAALLSPNATYLCVLYSMRLTPADIAVALRAVNTTGAAGGSRSAVAQSLPMNSAVTVIGRPGSKPIVLDLNGSSLFLNLTGLPAGQRVVFERLMLTGLATYQLNGSLPNTVNVPDALSQYPVLGNMASQVWAFDYLRRAPKLRLVDVQLYVPLAEIAALQSALLATPSASAQALPISSSITSSIQTVFTLASVSGHDNSSIAFSDVAYNGIEGLGVRYFSALPDNLDKPARSLVTPLVTVDLAALSGPAPALPGQPSPSSSLTAGAIAGITVGAALVCLVVVALIAVLLLLKRRVQRAEDEEKAVRESVQDQLQAIINSVANSDVQSRRALHSSGRSLSVGDVQRSKDGADTASTAGVLSHDAGSKDTGFFGLVPRRCDDNPARGQDRGMHRKQGNSCTNSSRDPSSLSSTRTDPSADVKVDAVPETDGAKHLHKPDLRTMSDPLKRAASQSLSAPDMNSIESSRLSNVESGATSLTKETAAQNGGAAVSDHGHAVTNRSSRSSRRGSQVNGTSGGVLSGGPLSHEKDNHSKMAASRASSRTAGSNASGSALKNNNNNSVVRGSHDVLDLQRPQPASPSQQLPAQSRSVLDPIYEPLGPPIVSILLDTCETVGVQPSASPSSPTHQQQQLDTSGSSKKAAVQGKTGGNQHQAANEAGQADAEARKALQGGGGVFDQGLAGDDGMPEDVLKRVIQHRKEMANLNLQNLEFQAILGQGSFGVVYKSVWRSMTVAVKVLVFQDASEAKRIRQRAITEAAINTLLTHDNIVNTYSHELKPISMGNNCAAMPDEVHAVSWKLYIVQEYCDAGSLSQAVDKGFFMDPRTKRNNMVSILQVAEDIARGMSYIHDNNIIHGDLSPGNVLLKSRYGTMGAYKAKVGDFGLSRFLDGPDNTHISNARQGTPFYTAPEVFAAGIISKEADVFSFGVLLWEMFCGPPPWRHAGTTAEERQQLDPRTYPYHVPVSCPSEYHELIMACLADDPKQRPKFADLLQRISDLLRLLRDALARRAAQIRVSQQQQQLGALLAGHMKSVGPSASAAATGDDVVPRSAQPAQQVLPKHELHPVLATPPALPAMDVAAQTAQLQRQQQWNVLPVHAVLPTTPTPAPAPTAAAAAGVNGGGGGLPVGNVQPKLDAKQGVPVAVPPIGNAKANFVFADYTNGAQLVTTQPLTHAQPAASARTGSPASMPRNAVATQLPPVHVHAAQAGPPVAAAATAGINSSGAVPQQAMHVDVISTNQGVSPVTAAHMAGAYGKISVVRRVGHAAAPTQRQSRAATAATVSTIRAEPAHVKSEIHTHDDGAPIKPVHVPVYQLAQGTRASASGTNSNPEVNPVNDSFAQPTATAAAGDAGVLQSASEPQVVHDAVQSISPAFVENPNGDASGTSSDSTQIDVSMNSFTEGHS